MHFNKHRSGSSQDSNPLSQRSWNHVPLRIIPSLSARPNLTNGNHELNSQKSSMNLNSSLRHSTRQSGSASDNKPPAKTVQELREFCTKRMKELMDSMLRSFT